ncbi:MAG: DUF1573 domain-containing protein [Nonlabens sp.]
MKKIVLMVAAVAAFAFTSCNDSKESVKIDEANLTAAAANKETASQYPVMEFEEEAYDFGTVNEGDVVEHTFKFTNTGNAPLIVVNAKSSCGCTVPTWTKEPVAPGAQGSLQVRFNTNGKPNAQTKAVTITANTEKGTESVRIKGTVTPKNKSTQPSA